MVNYTQRNSGLVVPVEPPRPKPKRGSLEIESDADRKKAGAALQSLMDLVQNHLAVDQDRRRGQRLAINHLAQHLLGPDVVFWEKT